ncbi:MAG: response regulator [Bacillota bacterium]
MNRILIINDSKFESMILNDMLSQMGYNVKISDEYSVMKHIQSFTPDIIMANYIMKETRGDKLIDQIKSKHPDIICVLTSNSMLDSQELVYHKVDAYIRTPVNKHNLSSTLKEVTERDKTASTYVVSATEEISSIREKLAKWKHKSELSDILDNAPVDKPKEGLCEPIVENSKEPEEKSIQQMLDDNKESAFGFCPYCGNKLMESESKFTFCPYCGHKLR